MLRDPEPSDATNFSAMMTQGISRWLASWPAPLPLAMAETRVAQARSGNAAGRSLTLTVTRRPGGEVMGYVSIHCPVPGRGVLGYWLGEAYQGQGYMQEAARALVDAGWNRLGLDTIEASARPGNAASFRIMRACGMTPSRDKVEYVPLRDRDELARVFALRRA